MMPVTRKLGIVQTGQVETTLADLVADPARITALPREAVPRLRGELAQLDTLLLGRLLVVGDGPEAAEEQIGVTEAASRLGVSADYLYRHHGRFPFTRREGRKLLFSAKGIEEYIHKKRPRT